MRRQNRLIILCDHFYHSIFLKGIKCDCWQQMALAAASLRKLNLDVAPSIDSFSYLRLSVRSTSHQTLEKWGFLYTVNMQTALSSTADSKQSNVYSFNL